ncbi:MAG: PQQ-like beta-propeller repeat protein [Chloroflexi bacterium]|nr:PQQ-like beta-propeller repeat protein [Chloroflexota bacterium]
MKKYVLLAVSLAVLASSLVIVASLLPDGCTTSRFTDPESHAVNYTHMENQETLNLTIQRIWDDIQLSRIKGMGMPIQIVNGQIILADTNCDEVVVLDVATSSVLWRTKIDNPQRMAVDNVGEILFVTTAHDKIIALKTTTGDILWENDMFLFKRTEIYFAMYDDTQMLAYVGIPGEMETFLLDKDGNLQPMIEYPRSAVHLAGKRWLEILPSSLALLDTDTGVIWETHVNCTVDVVFDPETNFLICSDRYNNIYSIDYLTGDVLWKFKGVISNIILLDEYAMFSAEPGRLVMVNTQSGALIDDIRWDFGLESNCKVSSSWLTTAGDQLFISFSFSEDLEICESFLVMAEFSLD